MENVMVQKELFRGVLQLQLKKVEPRKPKNEDGNEYYMLYFNQCVVYDAENWRNNKCFDVPYYCSKELLKEKFKGLLPSQLIEKEYIVEVEFSPSIRTYEGMKYADHRGTVVSIDVA